MLAPVARRAALPAARIYIADMCVDGSLRVRMHTPPTHPTKPNQVV